MTTRDADALTFEHRHPARFLAAAVLALMLPGRLLEAATPALERWVWGRRVTEDHEAAGA